MNLKSIIEKLKVREDFWRRQKEDPHDIGNAVIAALHEVRDAFEAEELERQRDAQETTKRILSQK